MAQILKMADYQENPDAPRVSFDDFWQAYPRRVAKKEAMKAWGRVLSLEHAKIMLALDKQKKSDDWRRDGGRYIPYPASWLNGERWTDELESDLTMGECMWNCNRNRDPDAPKCDRPGAVEKSGIVYCQMHGAMVNG